MSSAFALANGRGCCLLPNASHPSMHLPMKSGREQPSIVRHNSSQSFLKPGGTSCGATPISAQNWETACCCASLLLCTAVSSLFCPLRAICVPFLGHLTPSDCPFRSVCSGRDCPLGEVS